MHLEELTAQSSRARVPAPGLRPQIYPYIKPWAPAPSLETQIYPYMKHWAPDLTLGSQIYPYVHQALVSSPRPRAPDLEKTKNWILIQSCFFLVVCSWVFDQNKKDQGYPCPFVLFLFFQIGGPRPGAGVQGLQADEGQHQDDVEIEGLHDNQSGLWDAVLARQCERRKTSN